MHMLSPTTGRVNLVQVYAEVIGRRKCVNYIGRVNRLRVIRATQRGRGSMNPKASILCDGNEKQHFAPNKFTLNYFIFFGHRIPEMANSVAPVFCQAIPVRIHTALTRHLYNRHINFSQP